MPWLWNKISIPLACSSPIKVSLLVEEWLGRSDPYPLSMRLTGQDDNGYCDDYAVFNIICRVMRFSERWCHIDFDMLIACLVILEDISPDLPLLTCMVLGSDSDYWRTSLAEAFQVAPRLQTVTQGVQVYLCDADIPLHQLTSIPTSVSDYCDCLDALQRGLQLRKCLLQLRHAT
jgi:hypothetical protein